MTARFAVRWANYPGDRRGSVGQRMGPNALGEWLWVVTAEYDEAADRTRLGLSYVPPPELVGADTGQRS